MKKVVLLTDTGRRKVRVPYPDADHCIVEGACPACGSEELKAQGAGRRPSADDRAYEADAVSVCCGKHVGTLRAETGTLFGVREDEAMARYGVRIY